MVELPTDLTSVLESELESCPTLRSALGDNPKGIRNRIFDPFFTTKEVGRGTGQGLAIARSVVVERHKGSLSLESAVGEGTTFYVRLPIQSGDSSESGQGRTALKAGDDWSLIMRRVLFVDDEARTLEGLRRMLRSQRNEWDMAFAPGGEAALAIMEEELTALGVGDDLAAWRAMAAETRPLVAQV